MDDLNFRLQETDVKVDTFLNTLASLQDTLLHTQHEDSPAQAPSATRGKAMDADVDVGAMDVDVGATSGSKADNPVDDGVTYLAEEPWTEDLQPRWPEYSPYV
jgi:hypothetical protein